MTEGVKSYLTYDPDCHRISCAEHQVMEGFRIIPNMRKNLTIFLKGTSKIKYYFGVFTKQNVSFALEDGVIMTSLMNSDNDLQYFTFDLKSK